MMEKKDLRKADIISGSIIFLAGLWIVLQALKMPMKDSWGGVQNVWYVSPALFPLFVGGMIMILGLLLVRTALREVGLTAFARTMRLLAGPELVAYLRTPATFRFYAMVLLLFSFVYLNIPRIDFFLCSILFLVAFITMFYLDDDAILKEMFFFYLAGTLLFCLYFATGISAGLRDRWLFWDDIFTLLFILATMVYAGLLVRGRADLKKRFRTSLILALAAPFIVGSVFKYALLVPMPTEGLVVMLMDKVWYWDF